MTDDTKQKLKYWLLGIFTGGAVATPITAFFVKKVYDRKVEEAETRGMNAMAEYAISQQPTVSPAPNTTSEAITKDSEEDDGVDPTTINTHIDDEDGEESAMRDEAHERYLDMIDKYNSNSNDLGIRLISSDKFIEEQYMSKSYVNWYKEDNVFEEELKKIDDPYTSFGVTDGKELFRDDDTLEDPNVVYIRNERLLTDFEISRIHGSYAEMVGGETSLGETNSGM